MNNIQNIFKSLSEESRLRIIALLINRQLCVCKIEESLNMTQSNASKHLAILKNCGILESYKEAQWTYYKISENFINQNKELWQYLSKELLAMKSCLKDCNTDTTNCNNNKKPH